MATKKTPPAKPAKPATSAMPAKLLVLGAVLLLIISGTIWWRNVYSDPQRVFQAMLNNSLRTKSLTKEVTNSTYGQESTQVVYLQFGPENRAISETRLTQTDEETTTSVVTESIATPTADYIRYTHIDTNQQNEAGQPLDFSNILNVWGATDPEGSSKITGGQLYSETVLGVVPFGLLTKPQREELLELINDKDIYTVDYSAVGRSVVNGRPQYRYSVSVDAVGYATLLKEFGEAQGLNHLTELNPDDYANFGPLEFILTADVWSRQLKGIEYANGGRTEVFTSYNGLKEVKLPTQTISIQELEMRLQELQ